MIDLRKEVTAMVHRAIDSTHEYTGDEKDLNRHNWEQITTDRILAAIMQSLPDPIDIRSKYETGQTGGIFIDVDGENTPEKNEQQLEFLANYQSDQGWNHYFYEYTEYLKGLYTIPEPVLQSDHDTDTGIHGTSESDSTDNKEPSKVR